MLSLHLQLRGKLLYYYNLRFSANLGKIFPLKNIARLSKF